MPAVPAAPTDSRVFKLLLTVTIVAALYFLHEVIVPLAIAALITFLLAPVVSRLQRRLGRTAAVLLAVIITFTAIGTFGWVVVTQLSDLAWKLPTYKENLRTKLQSLTAANPGSFSGLTKMMQELEKETTDTTARTAGAGGAQPEKPVPVEVVEKPAAGGGNLHKLMGVVEPVLAPLGTAGVIVVLVVFMLFKREDLRDRIVGLAGKGHISETTRAMGEAAKRVNSFLLMQMIVNLSYGLPIAVGLYFIGVPNAALWGALAAVLRFIPYIGTLAGMIFPIALSLAVFDNWTGPLLTIALFITLEMTIAHVIEPWLYGASTGISSFALIVAALFWTWLWGSVGLVLSTPLTVCLLVMGKHIPGLAFLSMLLREEGALTPHEVCYHRLLAVDEAALRELVEGDLQRNGLEAVSSVTLLPALAMVEGDYQRGMLDRDRHEAVLQSMHEVVSEIEARALLKPSPEPAGAESQNGAAAAPLPPVDQRVVCVPAETLADEISARLLANLLRQHHFEADAASSKLLVSEVCTAVVEQKPDLVWICAVNPRGLSRSRHLCAELRRHLPDLRIMVGIWHPQDYVLSSTDGLKAEGAEGIVTGFEDAVFRSEAIRSVQGTGYVVAPIPDNEAMRLSALLGLHLDDTDHSEQFDRITSELSKIFDVPIALVSLVDRDRQLFASQCGLPGDMAAAGQTSRDVSVCGHVVAGNAPFVIEDLARDPRFAGNPLLRERKLRFYAGVPLRTSSGFAIGSLCILDTRPRKITEREMRLMQVIAEGLMCDLESRAASTNASAAALAV